MPKSLGSVGEIAAGAGIAALSLVPGAQPFAPFLISAGLSVGSMGAQGLLSRSKSDKKQYESFKQPPPVSFETDGQAVSARFYTYGRARHGGVFMFRESTGSYLGYGMILSCRPIDNLEALFVDDELLIVTSGYIGIGGTNPDGTPGFGHVDFGPGVYFPATGLKWTFFYTIITYWDSGSRSVKQTPVIVGDGPCGFLEMRNATDAGFSSTLLNYFFSAFGIWDWTHQARGLAVLYSAWYGFGATDRAYHYPRLFPTHSTAFRGHRVYDPRDLTQSFLDPVTGVYSVYNSTWKYSANPALVIADFLTFTEGFGLGSSDINWPSFIQAANDCDRVVTGYAGALEPFARAHLSWRADEERRDVMNKLLAACDGVIWEDGNGQVNLWINQWVAPTLTLTDADISGLTEEEANSVYADSNYVQPSYVEPRTNFSKNTALYVTDDASIALVGERKSTMDFEAVQSFNQAFRLAARALAQHNTPSKLTIRGGPRLLLADTQKVVGIDLAKYGISGVYRPTAPVVASDLANFSLTLSKVTEGMFVDAVPPFDPVNQFLFGVPYLANYVPPAPAAPSTSGSVIGTSGTITASVPGPPSDSSSNASFRFRPVDPSTYAPLGTGDWTLWAAYLGQYAAVSPNVDGVAGETQVFEVQAWFVTPTGTPGPYSASTFASVIF